MNTNPLMDFRTSIDLLDESLVNLLAERMRVVAKIAAHKKAHDLPFYMPDRWEGVVANKVNQGKAVGLDAPLVQQVFAAIQDAGNRISEGL